MPLKAAVFHSINVMFVVALLADQTRLPHALLTVALAAPMGLLASPVPAKAQTPSSVYRLVSIDAAPRYEKRHILYPSMLSMSRQSWPGPL